MQVATYCFETIRSPFHTVKNAKKIIKQAKTDIVNEIIHSKKFSSILYSCSMLSYLSATIALIAQNLLFSSVFIILGTVLIGSAFAIGIFTEHLKNRNSSQAIKTMIGNQKKFSENLIKTKEIVGDVSVNLFEKLKKIFNQEKESHKKAMELHSKSIKSDKKFLNFIDETERSTSDHSDNIHDYLKSKKNYDNNLNNIRNIEKGYLLSLKEENSQCKHNHQLGIEKMQKINSITHSSNENLRKAITNLEKNINCLENKLTSAKKKPYNLASSIY